MLLMWEQGVSSTRGKDGWDLIRAGVPNPFPLQEQAGLGEVRDCQWRGTVTVREFGVTQGT